MRRANEGRWMNSHEILGQMLAGLENGRKACVACDERYRVEDATIVGQRSSQGVARESKDERGRKSCD